MTTLTRYLVLAAATLLTACPCADIGDTLVCDLPLADEATPAPLSPACELTPGSAGGDADAWLSPWLALYYTADCTPADLDSLTAEVNGQPVKAWPMQAGPAEHGGGLCAIWWIGEGAPAGQPWTVTWHAGELSGSLSSADAPDWQAGWSVWYVGPSDDWPGEYGAVPGHYTPSCSAPLDWYNQIWW